MSVLDLPLEEQKRIAKEVFQMPFEEWVEDMKTSLKEAKEFQKKLENYKPTEEEKARKIKALRENPNAIHFYRRVTDNYNLTVEEAIEAIRRS
ncbi:hypothetical protein [Haemophilus paraphrohaemolyticus]|uniref:Uncharacterized protein n=1 Tax=Haemophilus paraphrohaemolyticus HK411 TaxID=1095743 RepID=I2NHC7_9PAST|nr:hypothetical protein [Haemophilus paraphrohaemolyticus]EIG25238.1 hypothetical protein HMPREF1054_1729 [Haemophilus paraphrohaemolyticus HK411]OOR94279.1 hypothetical protein B0184_08425 [Haemophilus paraphrohaemolyticus]STP01884.1 Uncharacterised protein [Haemophilus paraphrohaemolyticus]DAQ59286.1 MAG TPA: hypothetical protein [Caudoviricetes sp.]